MKGQRTACKAKVQIGMAPTDTQPREANRHSTPPRVPLWETQMTPHGHRPASRTDPHDTEASARVANVGPSTEVNALGQPVQAPQATAAELVANAAERLTAAQMTPAATGSIDAGRNPEQTGTSQRVTPGSTGADADLVTPPGGFQAGQVWLNNVFSPEMPAERPRWVALEV